MTSDLYRISKYKRYLQLDAESPDTRWYEGQLVFAGPDAALEVIGTQVNGYVSGVASHPEGQLAALIAHYKKSILKAAQALRLADTAAIVFSGKWHHVDPEQDPRFEGYLVHLVAGDGKVVTRRYASEIFSWDSEGYNNGSGFFAGGGERPDEDPANLHSHAELRLAPGKSSAACGMHALEGVVWFPLDGLNLPIVYSNVNGPDAPPLSIHANRVADPAYAYKQMADGTLLGELRARSQALNATPGIFRGKRVDRRSHRPDEMTLEETLASTDALGYWRQIQVGADEPFMTFEFFHDTDLLGEILTPVDAQIDRWTFGNMYASEWKPLGSSLPEYRKRILAVGLVPTISYDPI